MQLNYTEHTKLLRWGRASLSLRTRLPQEGELPESVTVLCQTTAKALEEWATERLLPELEQTLTNAPRQSRLHAPVQRLFYLCEWTALPEERLSLLQTVRLERDGEVRIHEDRRVFDHSGLLCPLELFLPRKKAKKYLRWSFVPKEGRVLVIPRKMRKNGEFLRWEEVEI